MRSLPLGWEQLRTLLAPSKMPRTSAARFRDWTQDEEIPTLAESLVVDVLEPVKKDYRLQIDDYRESWDHVCSIPLPLGAV